MWMLHGKSAIVTGSTSGIGLGMARALARNGANVMLNGFGDAGQIETLRRSFETEHGVQARYNAADMSKPEQIQQLVETAAREFGGLDILVNNAGVQHTAPVEEFPPERWESIISINLSAVFYGIHWALPHLRRKGWGRIINIASVHGLVASVQKAAYIAAKHGVVGLTKTVALETAGSGVTCNAICPGWVLTPLVQKQVDDRAAQRNISNEQAKRELLSEKQPSGQFVTPEQIGELAVFLCSPGADQMTGVAIPIDGAWTAQ
jgi:3-hydroxybutyrate dehydrogenase